MAHARALPDRRLVASQRPAYAVPEDPDRALRAAGGLLEGVAVATQEQRTSISWDYAPAPEAPDHVRLRGSYGLFIDGEFRDPGDGRRAARRAGRAGCPAGLGCAERARPWQVSVPDRAADPGACS